MATKDAVGPTVESFDTVPEYEPLRRALDEGEWEAVDAALAAWPGDEVSYALSLLADPDTLTEHRLDVIVGASSSPTARLAWANHHLGLAWQVRLRHPGSILPPDEFARFRRLLAEAEPVLIELCAEFPDFAPAWTARVHSARWLGLPASETRRRFARGAAIADDVWAAVHLHQFFETRWYGSADEARAVLDEILADVPDGSLSWTLVPRFHVERWAEAGGAESWDNPIRTDDVVDALREAAQRSVLHPERGQLTPTLVSAHNAFMVAFWLAGRPEEAARHRAAVGTRLTAPEWSWVTTDAVERTRIWQHLSFLGAAA